MPTRKPSVYIDKICPICGKNFKFYAAPSRKGKQAYCSNTCRYIGQKKYRNEITCARCGKIVVAPYKKSWRDSKKWCSWECYNADRQAEYVEKVCKECGKTFSVKKSIEHRFNVCSRKCRLAHNQVTIGICQICGKEFKYRKNNQVGKFCSLACYRKSVGETNFERAVRFAIETTGYFFEQEVQFGRYSADFYLPTVKIVIEADGDYWHVSRKDSNRRKDEFLRQKGISVIRILESAVTNHDNLSGFIENEITRLLKSSSQDTDLH